MKCVNVPSSIEQTGVIQLTDYAGLDPLLCRYLVLKNIETGTEYGYLPYQHVLALNGKLRIRDLLPMPPPMYQQQQAPQQPDVEHQDEKPADMSPFGILAMQPLRVARLQTETVAISDVSTRIAAILAKTDTEYNIGTIFVLQLLPMLLRRKLHNSPDLGYADKFDALQREYHLREFNARIRPFCVAGGEQDLIKLLHWNGTPKATLDTMTIFVASGLDPKDTAMILSRDLWTPKCLIVVRMDELPSVLLKIYPIHRGGLVHLHPIDAGQWLWYRGMLQSRLMRTAFWSSPHIEGIEETFWPICQQLVQTLKDMATAALNLRRSKRRRKGSASGATNTDPAGGNSIPIYDDVDRPDRSKEPKARIPDIETWNAILPPCLLNSISHWPKHEERKVLVAATREGGVSLQSLIELFKGLDPDEIKDYNPTQYYKSPYHPSLCTTIRARGDVQCPYTDNITCGKDVGLPTVSGPHTYIRRKLAKLQLQYDEPAEPGEDEKV